MVQQIAASITRYSISRNWIDASQREWCQYAMEKQLGQLLFGCMSLLLMICTQTWLPMISFISVCYLFRARMGGWHAKHIWSCQLLSMGTVIVAVFVLGPIIEQINCHLLFCIDALIILATLIMPPIYPIEAHFSQSVKKANVKRKNQMLVCLLILQFISLLASGTEFILYSLIGLVFTDFSVFLQYFKLQGG